MILWIIVSLVIFTLIVVLHELWHFWFARAFWVKVYEFWIWIPPKVKEIFTDKKWTKYTLNALPIWGFVRLAWENNAFFEIYDKDWNLLDNEEIEEKIEAWESIFDGNWEEIPINNVNEIKSALEEEKADFNMKNKAYYKQALILLWWVMMNFLTAIVIFSTLFMIWTKPIWINSVIETQRELKLIPTFEEALEKWIISKWDWLIIQPIEWWNAQKYGLKNMDVILKAWWTEIKNSENFIELLQESKGKELVLEVKRWESVIEKIIKANENWKIGAYIWENIVVNQGFEYKMEFLEAVKSWAIETYNQSILTLVWLKTIVTKIISPKEETERKEALESVSWPIWIVWVITNSMEKGIVFILILAWIISINLWIFNLLPLPALDWWRLFILTINKLSKLILWNNFIWYKAENAIHAGFFLILILLSIWVAYNDILRLL